MTKQNIGLFELVFIIPNEELKLRDKYKNSVKFINL